MKCFAILALIALVSGSPMNNDLEAKRTVPVIVGIASSSPPPRFRLVWTPVDELENGEAVIGYKINLWTFDSNPIYVLEEEHSLPSYRKIEASNEKALSSLNDLSKLQIVVSGADTTEATIFVKHNVAYKVQVQAYSENSDGQLSAPTTVRVYGSLFTNYRHYYDIFQ